MGLVFLFENSLPHNALSIITGEQVRERGLGVAYPCQGSIALPEGVSRPRPYLHLNPTSNRHHGGKCTEQLYRV